MPKKQKPQEKQREFIIPACDKKNPSKLDSLLLPDPLVEWLYGKAREKKFTLKRIILEILEDAKLEEEYPGFFKKLENKKEEDEEGESKYGYFEFGQANNIDKRLKDLPDLIKDILFTIKEHHQLFIELYDSNSYLNKKINFIYGFIIIVISLILWAIFH